MLFAHEVHEVIGAAEAEFEAAYRDEWLPMLAKDDEARLLWFTRRIHGTAHAYTFITLTAVRDGAAWQRLAERVQHGDLRDWFARVDAMRHRMTAKLLLPVFWSPMQNVDFTDVPSSATEHEPSIYMEDTDLVKDKGIRTIHKLFPLLAVISLAAPFLLGWGISGKLAGALSALIWAGFVRVALLHHVTWSINSICHVFGQRPFKSRGADRASNVWPLAVLSMGESWHNLHHADPSCARHGVDRFQLDSSARIIRWFEMFGWVRDVRWPNRAKLALRRVAA